MIPLLLNEIKLRFCQENIPRIMRCLELMPEDALGFRENENCNAVTNLVLHLDGNCRQWLLQHVFGNDYQRDRAKEFKENEVTQGQLLLILKRLQDDILYNCTNSTIPPLENILQIQGIDTTVLGAIIHSIEHFSYHTGQIALLTKQSLNKDLGFYAKHKQLNS